MRGEGHISQLVTHTTTFSQEELGNILIQSLRNYLSHKIELYELIEISETIRRFHIHQLPSPLAQVIISLHVLREDIHTPRKINLPEEDIRKEINNFLSILTREETVV